MAMVPVVTGERCLLFIIWEAVGEYLRAGTQRWRRIKEPEDSLYCSVLNHKYAGFTQKLWSRFVCCLITALTSSRLITIIVNIFVC